VHTVAVHCTRWWGQWWRTQLDERAANILANKGAVSNELYNAPADEDGSKYPELCKWQPLVLAKCKYMYDVSGKK